MKVAFLKIKSFVNKLSEAHKLPAALSLAIIIALSFTAMSVYLYSTSGASRFDLSRPGYEKEREEVRATESQKSYDTTSPITKGAIDSMLSEYDTRNKDLSEYGDFSDQALTDSDLQLTTDNPAQN